jgi:hypothetical protein
LAVGPVVPVSLQAHRDEQADGRTITTARSQVSTVAGRVLLAEGLSYAVNAGPGVPSQASLVGTLDGTGTIWGAWQLRTGLQYQIEPRLEVTTTTATLDRNLSQRMALRLGIQQAWTAGGSTSVHSGFTWRLPVCDVSLSPSYSTRPGRWQVLLRFSMGSLFDPMRGRYRMVRPGAAAGGALELHTFVDRDGDGRWTPGERGQPGLAVDTINGPASSDNDGRLLVTGLGDSARARLRIRQESVDDPYAVLPAAAVEFAPRPGRVAVADFPLQITGEVSVKLKIRDATGNERGVSALAVELVNATGEVVAQGRTEYDGTVIVEGLRPGSYELRLEPAQAARLHLRLASALLVVIPPAGGYAGVASGTVVVER